MNDKIQNLQFLLQQEAIRLGLNRTVIVREHPNNELSVAIFDPNTMIETDGWYQTWDDFFGTSMFYNFESALTMVYLASLSVSGLWEEYKDKTLRDEK